MRRKLKLMSLVFLLLSCGNNQDKHVPLDNLAQPIPVDPINVSEELKYIGESDQFLRNQMTLEDLWIMGAGKDLPIMDSIDFRDSIRWTRVKSLYDSGKVVSLEDKYYAGLVFLHTGGKRIKVDSLSHEISAQLFGEVAENIQDSAKKVDAKRFQEVAKGRINLIVDTTKKGWQLLYLEEDSTEAQSE